MGRPLRFRAALLRLVVIAAGLAGALVVPATGNAGVRPAPAVAWPGTDADAAPGVPVLTTDGVYLPPSVDPARPTHVLVALHGYAGSGRGIAARLRACADQYGWLLVAPTMAYRDYLDPEQLRADARENLPRVHGLIDRLRGSVSGLDLPPRLLLYGFSRGAQMAQRFSMLYSGEVAAVAVLSAGSYTLPEIEDDRRRPLRFPFGVADLPAIGERSFDARTFSQIPFWVGVGAADTNRADTARDWDWVEGETRLDRAQALANQLRHRSDEVALEVFNGVGHEETAAMRSSACAFLAAHAGA